MMRSWMFAAAAVTALALPAHAEFKLGWAGPLSGGSAAVGSQNRNGVQQAVEDLNAAGGILGEKIVVHFEDDASEPKQAVSVANRLMASSS